MIRCGEHAGMIAEIGDDYLLLDGGRVELRGIADMAALALFDDSDGAELLAARLHGIRTKRNTLLSASDWTQVADGPLDEEQQTAWRAYRQALRDMPAGVTQETMYAVRWPEPPVAD